MARLPHVGPALKPVGCSLSSLLLLGGVFAVLMAGARAVRSDPNSLGKELLIGLSVLGFGIGACIGFFVAHSRTHGWQAIVLWPLVGGCAGGLGALFVATPQSLMVVAVGAVVLILWACFIRWTTPPQEDD
jgi:hypothetical protein